MHSHAKATWRTSKSGITAELAISSPVCCIGSGARICGGQSTSKKQNPPQDNRSLFAHDYFMVFPVFVAIKYAQNQARDRIL
jgi:hypothetical protein